MFLALSVPAMRSDEKADLVEELDVVSLKGGEKFGIGVGLDEGVADLRDDYEAILLYAGDVGGFLDGGSSSGRGEAFWMREDVLVLEAEAVGEDVDATDDVDRGCRIAMKGVPAEDLFDQMQERNTVSWHLMIGGYTANDLACDGLLVFQKMKHAGVPLDGETFELVLAACAYAKAVEEGLFHLESTNENGIVPIVEHYLEGESVASEEPPEDGGVRVEGGRDDNA
ncbi:hypothetical protein V8G54_013509 [Vigna mungo]|uniref:Pentatricopeptide repeat-containing protein n=1 Tax=Vigna mungo TaxID=3915 RepID=A0AAQ3NUU2_VIGMU